MTWLQVAAFSQRVLALSVKWLETQWQNLPFQKLLLVADTPVNVPNVIITTDSFVPCEYVEWDQKY